MKKKTLITIIPNNKLGRFNPFLTVSVATYIAKPPEMPEIKPEK